MSARHQRTDEDEDWEEQIATAVTRTNDFELLVPLPRCSQEMFARACRCRRPWRRRARRCRRAGGRASSIRWGPAFSVRPHTTLTPDRRPSRRKVVAALRSASHGRATRCARAGGGKARGGAQPRRLRRCHVRAGLHRRDGHEEPHGRQGCAAEADGADRGGRLRAAPCLA